jgi:IclR family pca regulon transcriptional regulator
LTYGEQVEDPTMTLAASPAASTQSLVRGLAVIRTFDAEHSHQTLSDVARRADLSRATARRVLHTLVDVGYVATDGKVFSLRPRILELGHAYLNALGLPEVAIPHLQELRGVVDESCSVAVLDGTEVVYVARVATRAIMTVSIHVGTRFPAHVTSLGRVLLAGLPAAERSALLDSVELTPVTPKTITDRGRLEAELDRVARQGYALVDQELALGLRSLAAPIHDGRGRVTAAVNVSASARRGTRSTLRAELLDPLLEAAARIEHDLALVQRH